MCENGGHEASLRPWALHHVCILWGRPGSPSSPVCPPPTHTTTRTSTTHIFNNLSLPLSSFFSHSNLVPGYVWLFRYWTIVLFAFSEDRMSKYEIGHVRAWPLIGYILSCLVSPPCRRQPSTSDPPWWDPGQPHVALVSQRRRQQEAGITFPSPFRHPK